MSPKLTYLLLDIFSIAIPLAFSFEYRIKFFNQWKFWTPAIVITALPFILWDVLFTNWGIWGFNGKYLIGVHLLDLPLEEWLFFICIPYACLFTYVALKYLIKPWWSAQTTIVVTWMLISVLLLIAVLNLDKAYTATTFILLATALIFHTVKIGSIYLSHFYLSYLFILVPFFMVNGILTGSLISEEVVWYNDLENLGIRMFTIPVEDTFYGLLLILLNVTFFEYFKELNARQYQSSVQVQRRD